MSMYFLNKFIVDFNSIFEISALHCQQFTSAGAICRMHFMPSRGMTVSATNVQSAIAKRSLDVLETVSLMSCMILTMITMSHADYKAHSIDEHDDFIVNAPCTRIDPGQRHRTHRSDLWLICYFITPDFIHISFHPCF